MRRHLIATLAVLAAAGFGPASVATADSGPPAWATVNVCAPGAVGIRAGMPGDGSRARMYARFTVQWLDPRSGAWEPVQGIPTSPWLSAGSAEQLQGQTGWTFEFDPPPAGTVFHIRGLAELEWRGGGSKLGRQSLVTTWGLAGVDEGQPLGTSLASCSLG
jgi:hypothetical protein